MPLVEGTALIRNLMRGARPGVLRWLFCLGAPLAPAHAADALQVTLDHVEIDPTGWTERGYAPFEAGHIGYTKDGASVDYAWSAPPQGFGAEGFTVHLAVHATAAAGTPGRAGGDLTIASPFLDAESGAATARALADPGNSAAQEIDVHLVPKPDLSLSPGDTFYLEVRTSGPSTRYIYTLVALGPPMTAGLTVTDDCPPEIVISALPSVNCHLLIGGIRRDTAAPVIVELPERIDGFGNHANGIQVIGDGQHDPFDLDDPYLWGLFIFACPEQNHTGANCAAPITAPGTAMVPVIVRQGDVVAPHTLSFDAKPHPP